MIVSSEIEPQVSGPDLQLQWGLLHMQLQQTWRNKSHLKSPPPSPWMLCSLHFPDTFCRRQKETHSILPKPSMLAATKIKIRGFHQEPACLEVLMARCVSNHHFFRIAANLDFHFTENILCTWSHFLVQS